MQTTTSAREMYILILVLEKPFRDHLEGYVLSRERETVGRIHQMQSLISSIVMSGTGRNL